MRWLTVGCIAIGIYVLFSLAGMVYDYVSDSSEGDNMDEPAFTAIIGRFLGFPYGPPPPKRPKDPPPDMPSNPPPDKDSRPPSVPEEESLDNPNKPRIDNPTDYDDSYIFVVKETDGKRTVVPIKKNEYDKENSPQTE